MDEICIKYRTTRDDLKIFMFFYLNKVRHYNIYLVFSILLLIFSLFCWIMTDKNPSFMVMSFLALFAILYYASCYIIPVLRFKEEKAGEVTYLFTDEGIQVEREDATVKLGWRHYKAVFITPNFYIFKPGPRSYWGLPADAVEDRYNFDRLIFSQKEKSGLKVKVL